MVLTERRPHLLADVLNEFPVLHVIHEIQKNFYRREDDSGVPMLELDNDPFSNHLRLFGLSRDKSHQRIHDINLSPPDKSRIGHSFENNKAVHSL